MPHQDFIGADGKIWPSATELTALLPQPWLWSWYRRSVEKSGWQGWLDNKKKSDEGLEIGREVHGLIENFITKKKFECSGKYDSQKIADALFDNVNPLVEEYVSIEPHLVSQILKIHGSADAIVRLNYRCGLWVLDWKTAAGKSNTHPIQLAIYKICWDGVHPNQKLEGGIIARVDKKSKKLNVHLDEYVNLNQYYPVIESLREIWEYCNEKE